MVLVMAMMVLAEVVFSSATEDLTFLILYSFSWEEMLCFICRRETS